MYLEVDGEYAGRLPAKVEIAPESLMLLLPPITPAGQARKPDFYHGVPDAAPRPIPILV